MVLIFVWRHIFFRLSTCPSVVDFVLLVTDEIDFDLGSCFASESQAVRYLLLVSDVF